MRMFLHIRTLAWIALLSTTFVSCTSNPGKVIPLSSFTENDVDVTISLVQKADRKYALSGTFTPPDGYHLYSKDIPLTGVDGLGRPTLLELTPNSHMQAAGSLIESEKPQAPDFEPRKLSVYPSGPVTLSLAIELPEGTDWLQDEIQVTYMACSSGQCKPPVVGKVIPIRIPGAEAVEQ